MKTITVPGKTTSIGVQLVPALQAAANQTKSPAPPAACQLPYRILAFDGAVWSNNIRFDIPADATTWYRIVPLVLDWAGLQICLDLSATPTIWSLTNTGEMMAELLVSPNGIAAFLSVAGLGVATITAAIGPTVVLNANVTIEEEAPS